MNTISNYSMPRFSASQQELDRHPRVNANRVGEPFFMIDSKKKTIQILDNTPIARALRWLNPMCVFAKTTMAGVIGFGAYIGATALQAGATLSGIVTLGITAAAVKQFWEHTKGSEASGQAIQQNTLDCLNDPSFEVIDTRPVAIPNAS